MSLQPLVELSRWSMARGTEARRFRVANKIANAAGWIMRGSLGYVILGRPYDFYGARIQAAKELELTEIAEPWQAANRKRVSAFYKSLLSRLGEGGAEAITTLVSYAYYHHRDDEWQPSKSKTKEAVKLLFKSYHDDSLSPKELAAVIKLLFDLLAASKSRFRNRNIAAGLLEFLSESVTKEGINLPHDLLILIDKFLDMSPIDGIPESEALYLGRIWFMYSNHLQRRFGDIPLSDRLVYISLLMKIEFALRRPIADEDRLPRARAAAQEALDFARSKKLDLGLTSQIVAILGRPRVQVRKADTPFISMVRKFVYMDYILRAHSREKMSFDDLVDSFIDRLRQKTWSQRPFFDHLTDIFEQIDAKQRAGEESSALDVLMYSFYQSIGAVADPPAF